MNAQTRAIALRYSNAELLRHWELFGTYPTSDRRQMERVNALLRGEWPEEAAVGRRAGMPQPLVTPAKIRREWARSVA